MPNQDKFIQALTENPKATFILQVWSNRHKDCKWSLSKDARLNENSAVQLLYIRVTPETGKRSWKPIGFVCPLCGEMALFKDCAKE